MSNKNPTVIVMLQKDINFDDFIASLKYDWNIECKYDKSEQSNFISYSFNYGNMLFACSKFGTRFPDKEVKSDIEESIYGNQLEEIYEDHTNFWIISVIENSEKDLTKVYTFFTHVIMSMLHACGKCLVYDIKSRLVIESDVYLQAYDNMKSWYKQDKYIFPINWYVNIKVHEYEGKLNAYTIGFEAFNDYEIEIHNKSIQYKEIFSIMKFIVVNVISRQDKIKNRDIIPIPLNGKEDEAIVKQFDSEILKKQALAIIF